VFDEATLRWSPVGPPSSARSSVATLRLDDGDVLVVGGSDGSPLATVERFHPATSAFLTAAPLGTPREAHTATLLPDGRVLVAGGERTFAAFLSSAEISDPGVGAWTATVAMSEVRMAHTATLLLDGRVLIAGGTNGSTTLSSSEAFAGACDVDGASLVTPSGTKTSCAPYRCPLRSDACLTRCAAASDCVDGTACDAHGACVPAPGATDGGSSGCATARRGTSEGGSGAALGFLLWLGARWRSRRRRARGAPAP
jgi:hypothetical protein